MASIEEETSMEKRHGTPEDYVHIIAALLAAGDAPTEAPPDRPNFASAMLMTKYRQYVRKLSRNQPS
jgi:hypothetical protein